MKTIRLAFIALLLAVSSFALSAQSIVGTWECSGKDDDGADVVTTLTFNEDGTFVRVQKQNMLNFKNESAPVTIQEGGRWKLISGGKRIRMKINSSTVMADSGQESHGAIAKLAKINEKLNALSTLYIPKIKSLTDNELILLEGLTEEIGPDEPTSLTVEVTYTRKN